jgi:tripartite-type tricarboxylate transporter receptor subunit TctC
MDHGRLGTRPLRRRAVFALAASGLAAAGARTAYGADTDWPAQPVRYINLFAPGGATDVMSRLYCSKMSELAKQQFIVENRAGAGGTVGQAAIAHAAPDGYTVGLGSVASLSVAPSLYPSLPYDPAKDFTFISGIWQVPNLLFCNLALPVRSVPELVALVKANPGKFVYGSGGSGTTPHLTMELFKQKAGLDIIHVPYRGGAPAMVDLMGGRVQMMFDNVPTAIGAVRDGKVRALAVTGAERNEALPGIPAMKEFYPGFEITSWGSLVGPAGLPRPIVQRLSALTRRALQDPELIRRFAENGGTTWWTSPEDLAAFRTEQAALFARLVQASGARVD